MPCLPGSSVDELGCVCMTLTIMCVVFQFCHLFKHDVNLWYDWSGQYSISSFAARRSADPSESLVTLYWSHQALFNVKNYRNPCIRFFCSSNYKGSIFKLLFRKVVKTLHFLNEKGYRSGVCSMSCSSKIRQHEFQGWQILTPITQSFGM